jgi:pyruvate,water dikinase
MSWLSWIKTARHAQDEQDEAARKLRETFAVFLNLLESNNQVLKRLSDLEEKALGEQQFDRQYIHTAVVAISDGVESIVDSLIILAGARYSDLRERYAQIDATLKALVSSSDAVPRDALIVDLDSSGPQQVGIIGHKNAKLAELKASLDVPTPDGVAITTWAYQRFMEAGSLQQQIDTCIESLDIRRYADLEQVSEQIRKHVLSTDVPADLVDELEETIAILCARSGATRFALRSSAIGEDTHFSFAGQYISLLGVSADRIIDGYREVLAGKFTPKALYYMLSHAFRETDLPMSVGCLAMIDARASGVVYTRDPLNPDDDSLLVNSIFGLGACLVDGTLTPDVFRVSRSDLSTLTQQIECKPMRMVIGEHSGTVIEPVPQDLQRTPSIGPDVIRQLAELALRVEAHHDCPQDIEWAIDHDDRLYLLQARQLRVLRRHRLVPEPDISGLDVVLAGGTTVCPGAGSGQVHHVTMSADLTGVPEGCVLVAPHPFPGLIAVMQKVTAIITAVGGVASHMATMAREYGIPTIMGLQDATGIPEGQTVTVDASTATVYQGDQRALVTARATDDRNHADPGSVAQLKQVLTHLSPLNLLHPVDPEFTIANCKTFHDITRFAHQKAVQEMFERASGRHGKYEFGHVLKTKIPLQINILYLDEEILIDKKSRWVSEDRIDSRPMQKFWDGLRQEGWPNRRPPNVQHSYTPAAAETTGFSEDSFAFLGREYMLLNLRLGYHFMTIEAMSTPEPNNNLVRLQYKHGGMWFDRRVRRLKLITEILSAVGFENSSKGDFLDSQISHIDQAAVCERLILLGRLTIMTKQLDMALTNDDVSDWYTQEFMQRLGLTANRIEE